MLKIIHNIRLLTFIISWVAAFISIVNNHNIIVDIGVFAFVILFVSKELRTNVQYCLYELRDALLNLK